MSIMHIVMTTMMTMVMMMMMIVMMMVMVMEMNIDDQYKFVLNLCCTFLAFGNYRLLQFRSSLNLVGNQFCASLKCKPHKLDYIILCVMLF